MSLPTTLSDDLQRRALARRRALRAAAAVATTLFAALPAGCAVTVAQGPGAEPDPDASPATDPDAAQAAADTGAVPSADAASAPAPDAPHPPADARTVAMADAGSAADAPRDPCTACGDLLDQGEWPACTSDYIQCIQAAAQQTGEECPWACAAWGPFVPPAMDA